MNRLLKFVLVLALLSGYIIMFVRVLRFWYLVRHPRMEDLLF